MLAEVIPTHVWHDWSAAALANSDLDSGHMTWSRVFYDFILDSGFDPFDAFYRSLKVKKCAFKTIQMRKDFIRVKY